MMNLSFLTILISFLTNGFYSFKQSITIIPSTLSSSLSSSFSSPFSSPFSSSSSNSFPSNTNEYSQTLKSKPISNNALYNKIDQEIEPRAKKFFSSLINNLQENSYIDSPILIIANNRAEFLEPSLESLLKCDGVKRENIIAVQYGSDPKVAEIIKQNQIRLVQNSNIESRLKYQEGSVKIATHYKEAIKIAFDAFPKSKGLVIVEEDLLFAPDFYTYLTSVAPILDYDKSVFAVSAWNDNGFSSHVHPHFSKFDEDKTPISINPYHSTDKSFQNQYDFSSQHLRKNEYIDHLNQKNYYLDLYALRRTSFFPGLGWLLQRDLFFEELYRNWPRDHWDHWLRSPAIHKNRDVVYPLVPRTYHAGIKGTFMDMNTHNRYFADIAMNQDPSISWKGIEDENGIFHHFMKVYPVFYDYRVQKLKSYCIRVNSVEELTQYKDSTICIEYSKNEFSFYANYFKLWHEKARGEHRGLHEFYHGSNYILLYHSDNTFHLRGTSNRDKLSIKKIKKIKSSINY